MNNFLGGDDEVVLAVHEWVAASTIAAFFLFLSLMAYLGRSEDNVGSVDLHYLKPQELKVSVEGAVSHPGVYSLSVGGTYADLFERAKPLENADLRKVNLNARLRSGRRVVVRRLPTIEVEVYGAVEAPGRVVLPKGACLLDLLQYVVVSQNADTSQFESSRILKNGERVFVKANVEE